MHNNKDENRNIAYHGHSSIASHLETETQFQKYHNSRAGHGFAAEDANALHEKLLGNNVDKVGYNNRLNGADRLTNGIAIQTKYYQTARKTIDSAFDKTGYRYNGQQLEVPADQYDECVSIFKDKISSASVKDINGNIIDDVNEANKIIKKGSVTYEQAKKIAKSGNIESLKFDAKNNIVSSSYIGGISFAISFALHIWRGEEIEDAFTGALLDGINAGGIAALIGIASSQLLRTRSASAMTMLIRCGVKPVYGTSIGKASIDAIAKASLGKAISGAAAINHVSKLLKSNFVTAGITTAIMVTPDFYRALISQNISWAQFGKNLAVNVAGVAGGVGGWAAGSAAGAAVGSFIPIVGTVAGGIIGGLLGAFGGGVGASQVAKSGLDQFIKDDAQEMLELVQDVTENICEDYLFSEDEVKVLVDHIKYTITADWLREMYGSGEYNFERKEYAYNKFALKSDSIISQRKFITLPTEGEYMCQMEKALITMINT